MTKFNTDKKFDLVLCICDSLNYILGFENQINVLKNAYQYLEDNGTLIFDIHSQYKINELFKNYIEEDENDDFYFYWKVTKTDNYQITHYVIIEDLNDDIRLEEKHIQESYPIEWYMKALKDIDTVNGPEACIGCGMCTHHCPQSIDIPGIMAEIAGLL